MLTCNECLHIGNCSWDFDGVVCEDFKDKTKFIELPCRIGDYIKWRNECGDIVILEVTGFDFDKKGNAIKYHTKYSDIQPYVDETEIAPKERLSKREDD